MMSSIFYGEIKEDKLKTWSEIHMIFWLRITGLKDWEDGTFSL